MDFLFWFTKTKLNFNVKITKTEIQNYTYESNVLVMALENVNVHSCMKWEIVHKVYSYNIRYSQLLTIMQVIKGNRTLKIANNKKH